MRGHKANDRRKALRVKSFTPTGGMMRARAELLSKDEARRDLSLVFASTADPCRCFDAVREQ